MINYNTFSIVARFPIYGMFGVAISTGVPAVGARCSFARANIGAIASQAWSSPLLGIDGLDLLDQGLSADDTMKKLLEMDAEPEKRQLSIVDAEGNSVAHTGCATDPWCGHRTGPDYAVAGNMLVGEETITVMAEAFEASASQSAPNRLLAALDAGQVAGGDKRGRRSAALYIVRDDPFPYLDLRVDEHPDPVVELGRILQVAEKELLPFVEAMPTRENPKGNFEEGLKSKLRRKVDPRQDAH